MKQLIEQYLEDQKTSWSPTTLKSERSRLAGIAKWLDLTPAELHKALLLDGRKPYSIKTTFIRVCNFEAWLVKNGHKTETPFKEFMNKHKNRFKYAYTKEEIDISFKEAIRRIKTLEEPFKSMAMGLITTGLRVSEVNNMKDGKVTGKGGKQRTVYGKIEKTAPYATFWRKLKAVGLKPHTLRKLCATRLGEKGATPADLCKVFGWSSINTAYVYLQGKDDERLQAFMTKAIKGK